MRYLGQWRSLPIAVDGAARVARRGVARFHAEHEREYTYRRDDAPVEIYRLQRRARSASTPKPELAAARARRRAQPEPAGARAGHFDEARRRSTRRVYARDDLPAGARFEGPAIDRPARLDDARPARRRGRGRRVAEHPHARSSRRTTS